MSTDESVAAPVAGESAVVVARPASTRAAPTRAAPTQAPTRAAPMRHAAAASRRPAGVRGWAEVVAAWAGIALVGTVVVLYALSPVFAERDQHRLLAAYHAQVHEAGLEATGLFGITLPTEPPATGSTVGILEIGRLHLQQAVTEGVGPAETERGPGHVPGTAGLGQPGNAAVVGRRSAFGGPFSHLASLRPGDRIVVTTTEGQSLYVVRQVRSLALAASPSAAAGSTASPPTAPRALGRSIDTDELYGTGVGNRLTLVTSASVLPWNTAAATVAVATLVTRPFTPTPQQSSSPSGDGRSAAGGAWAPLALAVEAFALAALGAVVLYRRVPLRSAYLLSTAPLVVVTILVALAVGRALPAWT